MPERITSTISSVWSDVLPHTKSVISLSEHSAKAGQRVPSPPSFFRSVSYTHLDVYKRQLIPGAAQAWGLSVEGCTASEPQRILDALADGKLVVALMTKGHFTKSGHFIVLRGVQDEKILVADPASYRRSQKVWDLSIILNEASRQMCIRDRLKTQALLRSDE